MPISLTLSKYNNDCCNCFLFRKILFNALFVNEKSFNAAAAAVLLLLSIEFTGFEAFKT